MRQVAEAVEAEQDAEAVGEAEENAEEELRKAEEELRCIRDTHFVVFMY